MQNTFRTHHRAATIHRGKRSIVLLSGLLLLCVVLALPCLPLAGQGTARALQRVPNLQVDLPEFAPLQPQGTAANYGLFVGINEFDPQSGLPDLKFAVNDAIALSHVLALELELIPPENLWLGLSGEPLHEPHSSRLQALRAAGVHFFPATRSAVINAISAVMQKAEHSESLVFSSFATHGFEDDHEAFIMPADGSGSAIRQSGISLHKVRDEIEGTRANKRILIIDACRELLDAAPDTAASDGASGRGLSATPQPSGGPSKFYGRGSGRGLRSVRNLDSGFVDSLRNSRGMALLLSCGPGETAWEFEDIRQGVFTYFLIDALKGKAQADPDTGHITLGAVFKYAAQETERWVSENGDGQIQRPRQNIDGSAADIPLALSPAMLRRIASLMEDDQILAAALARIDAAHRTNPKLIKAGMASAVEARLLQLRKSGQVEAFDTLLGHVNHLLGGGNALYHPFFVTAWQQFQLAHPPSGLDEIMAAKEDDELIAADFRAEAAPVDPNAERVRSTLQLLEDAIIGKAWQQASTALAQLRALAAEGAAPSLAGRLSVLDERLRLARKATLLDALEAAYSTADWAALRTQLAAVDSDPILQQMSLQDSLSHYRQTVREVEGLRPLLLNILAALDAGNVPFAQSQFAQAQPLAARYALNDGPLWQEVASRIEDAAQRAAQWQQAYARLQAALANFQLADVTQLAAELATLGAQRPAWIAQSEAPMAVLRQQFQQRWLELAQQQLTALRADGDFAGTLLLLSQLAAQSAEFADFRAPATWQRSRQWAVDAQNAQTALARNADFGQQMETLWGARDLLGLQALQTQWQEWLRSPQGQGVEPAAAAQWTERIARAKTAALLLHRAEAQMNEAALAAASETAREAARIWQSLQWSAHAEQASAMAVQLDSQLRRQAAFAQRVAALERQIADGAYATALEELRDARVDTLTDAEAERLFALEGALYTAWQAAVDRRIENAMAGSSAAEISAVAAELEAIATQAPQLQSRLRGAAELKALSLQLSQWAALKSGVEVAVQNADWQRAEHQLVTLRSLQSTLPERFIDAQRVSALAERIESERTRRIAAIAHAERIAQLRTQRDEQWNAIKAAIAAGEIPAILAEIQRLEAVVTATPEIGWPVRDWQGWKQQLAAQLSAQITDQIARPAAARDRVALQSMLLEVRSLGEQAPWLASALDTQGFSDLLAALKGMERQQLAIQQQMAAQQWRQALEASRQLLADSTALDWPEMTARSLDLIERSQRGLAAQNAAAAARAAQAQVAELTAQWSEILDALRARMAAADLAGFYALQQAQGPIPQQLPESLQRQWQALDAQFAQQLRSQLRAATQQALTSAQAAEIDAVLAETEQWETRMAVPFERAQRVALTARLDNLREAERLVSGAQSAAAAQRWQTAADLAAAAGKIYQQLQLAAQADALRAQAQTWTQQQLARSQAGSANVLLGLLQRADARIEAQLAGRRLFTRRGASQWNDWLKGVWEAHRSLIQENTSLQQQFSDVQKRIRDNTARRTILW